MILCIEPIVSRQPVDTSATSTRKHPRTEYLSKEILFLYVSYYTYFLYLTLHTTFFYLLILFLTARPHDLALSTEFT